MNLIVPIKQVPETSEVKMDESTGTMIREGVECTVNPLDLYAIEAALRLREVHGGKATAISMGPMKALEALREAIAMGCDDAILLSDSSFAGSDTWATSLVLSRAILRLGIPHLIICGERATDGDTAQVGPGIASFLDLPVSTYTSHIEIDALRGEARVRRMVEEGYEVWRLPLPALVTVVKEIAEPRLPTLKGKRRAKRMEIPIWGLEELGLEKGETGLAGSPTRVVKIFRPTISRQGKVFTARDESHVDEACEALVKFLEERGLLG